MPDPELIAALEADGLVERPVGGGAPRPSRRVDAALARAAARLQREGIPWRGLRLPIAAALLELRPELPNVEIARRTEALLPLVEGTVPSLLASEPAAPGG